MTVSVIIVTYQSAALLADCLQTLQSMDLREVIVVDNGSNDGSADIAACYADKVMRQEHNQGFGKAANSGARSASGQALCFLNPDCMLSSEVLAEARQCIGREPDACYAPNFVYHGGIKQAGCQAGYTRLKLLSDMIETNGMAGRLSRRLKANPKYHATDWNWPLGTCFFVLKEHFLEVGGFDPAYFVYMEDVELGLSLKLAGKETRPLCGTLIHAAQTGSDICSDTRRNLVNDGRLKYARKHYGRLFYGLLRLIAIAGRRYGIRSCNR